MKITKLLPLFALIFIVACTKTAIHATPEKVDECFTEHAEDSYNEKLEHCQEEICWDDHRCFEEVRELSEKYK